MKNNPENTSYLFIIEDDLTKLNQQINDWVISFISGSKEKSLLRVNFEFDLTKVEDMAYLGCTAEVFRGLRPIASWHSTSKFGIPTEE